MKPPHQLCLEASRARSRPTRQRRVLKVICAMSSLGVNQPFPQSTTIGVPAPCLSQPAAAGGMLVARAAGFGALVTTSSGWFPAAVLFAARDCDVFSSPFHWDAAA